MQNGYLIDLDNTLFDRELFGDYYTQRALEVLGPVGKAVFEQEYERSKTAIVSAACRTAARLGEGLSGEQIFSDVYCSASFEDLLLPGALEFLYRVQRDGPVKILTHGDAMLQKIKMRGSGIFDVIDEANVLVTQDKDGDLGAVLEALYREGAVVINNFNDSPAELRTAYRKDQTIRSVWVAYGRYAEAFSGKTLDFPHLVVASPYEAHRLVFSEDWETRREIGQMFFSGRSKEAP